MDQQSLYRDIAGRTDGDIYIGVVGPVRTGKSAFIKRFMELLVLPNIVGEHRRQRAVDELPQSGDGRTIMTTQPKFVPDEAVELKLRDEATARVRLVDCVGYLVRGVLGTQEEARSRMVRTPWFEHDIPFEDAAEIGTRRVIAEHSTIGMVVTSDGSVTDLPRSAYTEAEERVVSELRALGKPFAVVLNSAHPAEEDTLSLAKALSEKYDVPVRPLSALEMSTEDALGVLESVLFEFPLTEARIALPGWISTLAPEHWLVERVMSAARAAAAKMHRLKDYGAVVEAFSALSDLGGAQTKRLRLGEGAAEYAFQPEEKLFFRVLGEASGQQVEGEEHLLTLMTELVMAKREYDRVAEALKSVRETGYGLVAPERAELTLDTPEIVRQGNRFGVRLKASAPSLHMMRVDIGTEVSPIVGTEKQSEELVKYLLSEFESDPSGIWETNLFGKSLEDLVREGLAGKLTHMPAEAREKMRDALSKIINEGNGGVLCILL